MSYKDYVNPNILSEEEYCANFASAKKDVFKALGIDPASISATTSFVATETAINMPPNLYDVMALYAAHYCNAASSVILNLQSKANRSELDRLGVILSPEAFLKRTLQENVTINDSLALTAGTSVVEAFKQTFISFGIPEEEYTAFITEADELLSSTDAEVKIEIHGDLSRAPTGIERAVVTQPNTGFLEISCGNDICVTGMIVFGEDSYLLEVVRNPKTLDVVSLMSVLLPDYKHGSQDRNTGLLSVAGEGDFSLAYSSNAGQGRLSNSVSYGGLKNLVQGAVNTIRLDRQKGRCLKCGDRASKGALDGFGCLCHDCAGLGKCGVCGEVVRVEEKGTAINRMKSTDNDFFSGDNSKIYHKRCRCECTLCSSRTYEPAENTILDMKGRAMVVYNFNRVSNGRMRSVSSDDPHSAMIVEPEELSLYYCSSCLDRYKANSAEELYKHACSSLSNYSQLVLNNDPGSTLTRKLKEAVSGLGIEEVWSGNTSLNIGVDSYFKKISRITSGDFSLVTTDEAKKGLLLDLLREAGFDINE